MSGTMASTGGRVPGVVTVIGIVLLAAGALAAIVVRIVAMVGASSGPMPVLHLKDYTGYQFGPASPLTNPYALSDTMVLVALGVAVVGLLTLVLGVALRATRRRAR